MVEDLRGHLDLYRELQSLVEAEHRTLRQPEPPGAPLQSEARKNLLPRLDASLDSLRQHRAHWLKIDPAERARHPEVGVLLRQCQDAVLKIVVLDRENEQALLRRGLLAPRDLPAANRQRPDFVADLYRRQGRGSA
jgi:hypothetical protein